MLWFTLMSNTYKPKQTCWDNGDARYSAGRSLSKRLAFDDFTGEVIEAPTLSEVSFGP